MQDISIIIPVYNAEKYLPQCLDSIIQQRFTSLEVVLVDDGSTDDSSAICQSYAQNDTRIFIHTQKNQGAVAARNAGINLATGKHLMFVDADDWITPDYCAHMLQTQLKTNADIVFCEVTVIRHEQRIQTTQYNPVLRSSLIQRLSLIKETFYPAPWAKLYNTALIKENNLQFMVQKGYYGFAEDILFSLQTSYVAKSIAFCPDATYFYNRDNELSLCAYPTLQGRNNNDRLIIIGEMLHFLIKTNIPFKQSGSVLQAVENHLRWGGRNTLHTFMRNLHKENYPQEIILYFENFFAQWKKNENLLDIMRDLCKQILQKFPFFYTRLAQIYRANKNTKKPHDH